MRFSSDVDSFISYLRANRGLSANTLKAYRCDIEACLHLFELRGVVSLNEITLNDLRSWMATESHNHARSSMARKTVAVRGFFAWGYEHGVVGVNPAATLMTPSIPNTLPTVLTESQAEQLLDCAEHSEALQRKNRDISNDFSADGPHSARGRIGRGKSQNASGMWRFSNCCMPPASAWLNWFLWIFVMSTFPIAPSE